MKPIAPVPWRKTLRAEAKGLDRRHVRLSEAPEPIPGSTWFRRHWGQMTPTERTTFWQRKA